MTELPEPTGIWRLIALPGKVRRQGWAWFSRRIKHEFLMPTTGATRVLGALRVKFERARFSTRQRSRASDPGTLYFFLDFEISPVTYDCATYVAAAELRRRELGLSALHVVVVPGTVEGLREETVEYEAAINKEGRRWRLHNLVIPLFRLLPNCTGYTICDSRAEAFKLYADVENVYPADYSVSVPTLPMRRETCDAARQGRQVMPMFRATPKGLAYMRDFLEPHAQGRRVVVINLRTSPSMPVRNSTDANWFTFARELDKTKWLPVFVMDTDVALQPLPPEMDEFVVCHPIPWNVELRMALYELADLVMSIGQGPLELCWLNDRVSYAHFVRPNSSPQASDEYHRFTGFNIGGNPPYAVPGQRWVWTSDTLESIRSTFAEMTAEMKDE